MDSNRRLAQAGEKLGIIALASPCQRERFFKGIQALQSYGFDCKVALDPCREYGRTEFLFSSDSAQRRAEALGDLFADPSVPAILCARGGYGSAEVLPFLDYAKLRLNSKSVVGLSDATAVLVTLYDKARCPVIYGPSIESAFSRSAESQECRRSAAMLVEYLKGAVDNPLEGCKVGALCGRGKACGPLVGGNLTVLCTLLGTPWEPDFSDHILFLEEIGEAPYRIHRMLWQMKCAGKLSNLRGVLLGDFKKCEHKRGLGPRLTAVIQDIFGGFKYPVVGFIPSGHSDFCVPVPLGRTALMGEDRVDLQ